jgi:hypothetical protein
MLEEMAHPQELFYQDWCDNVPFNAVVAKIDVSETDGPTNSQQFFAK